VDNITGGAGDAVDNITGGAGDAVSDLTGGAGDAVEEVTGGAGDAVKVLTGGAGDTVDNITGGAGDAVSDLTGGATGAVDNLTGGATDAVKDLTGDSGGAVNGVAGPSGGAGDSTSDLPAKLIASVPPRGDTGMGIVEGISISKRQQISVDPFFSEEGVGNDLPSVVQAPGSALGEAAGASSGSLELPFGLGTLPLTGVQLALIMLTALVTAFMGCVIARLARTNDAQVGGAPGLQTI
ncbi:MAG: hypothetical protein M3124_07995, partial [Actinomycetota bacterium]|nr:hypothetical protein [Actinomycetota bacterium]